MASESLEKIPIPKSFYLPPTHAQSWGGESPIFRLSDTTLHWVDPLSTPPELHILPLSPSTYSPLGPARILQLEDSVSVVCFRQEKYLQEGRKSYICAYYQGVAFLDEETGKLEIVKEIIPTEMREVRRFNDGAIDAKGRFWLSEIDKTAVSFGLGGLPKTYGLPKGRLWRYDPDGTVHKMDEGVVCGNGVGWSPDNKTMYHNDSLGQKTWVYDFDLETGGISNKRLFLDFEGTEGEQDGLVVDTDGNIWTAVYGSNRIRMVFDPTGKKIKELVLPAKKMTCPTWGGKNNDILFATSALNGEDKHDLGGNLFRHDLPAGTVRGLPKNEFSG